VLFPPTPDKKLKNIYKNIDEKYSEIFGEWNVTN
jgi:hypothetical protein